MAGPLFINEWAERFEATAQPPSRHPHLVNRIRQVASDPDVLGDEGADVLAQEGRDCIARRVLRPNILGL